MNLLVGFVFGVLITFSLLNFVGGFLLSGILVVAQKWRVV